MRKLICIICIIPFLTNLHGQVTIENLLSVPFPSELKSSRDGKRIAWVFNDNGIRNVYAADAPAFAVRKLTKHNSDDGLDITSIKFSDDGTKIFFTDGNTNNGAGEAANPAMLQEKTGQFIWVINYDGSGLRKIGAGDNAVA